MSHTTGTKRWGYLAQFSDPDSLCAAVKRLRSDGFQRLDVFTPFPLEDLSDSLGDRASPMPWIMFTGGLLGGLTVYGLEYWVNQFAYPLNIGGRPLFSWPSFVPPAFEGTVLGAAIFGLLGLLWVCRLPRLHHPVFEIEQFKQASVDGFFVSVEHEDGGQSDLLSRLKELGAIDAWEVPGG